MEVNFGSIVIELRKGHTVYCHIADLGKGKCAVPIQISKACAFQVNFIDPRLEIWTRQRDVADIVKIDVVQINSCNRVFAVIGAKDKDILPLATLQ